MKHLLIIGLVIPEPASTAAGHRMLQLMDLFSSNDYRITFLTTANNIEFSEKINVQKIEMNDSSFDELIKQLDPQIVLFDRYIAEEQFGWRVAEACPKALKILDTEDLHFLREARRKAFVENRAVEKTDFINDIFKREIASILRCDLSLIISEFEIDLLQKQLNISADLLYYLPFLTDDFSKESTAFNKRNHFVSIGNFLHEPNWQTVLQLKKIWKFIRKKLPEAELHIYGAYASEKVYQLHNENEGFMVKGRAQSVREIFTQYRVLLAPIPFGAGLKGKLWEGMIYGLPNVTSTIGAEGMKGNLQWNGFIEDEENAFCKKAVELYTNEKSWTETQEYGYSILENRFMKSDFDEEFINKVQEIQDGLLEHRQLNFLGQILQHHQLNSTKYLSKWIEEKSKSV